MTPTGPRGRFPMRRFLLDTGIAALHLDRKRGVFERAAVEVARGNRVGIAAPVLAELAFRAEGSPQRDRKLLRLRQALDVWKLWLVDTAAAFEYGRLAFELKTIGRPMGQNDIMIAAIALSLGNTTVVTMDAVRRCGIPTRQTVDAGTVSQGSSEERVAVQDSRGGCLVRRDGDLLHEVS